MTGEVYQLTLAFPKEEAYYLMSQIRRSSRSIGAQIAEAWGKRSYIKCFSSKLTDALSELYETEHWIEIAENCGYISKDIKNGLHLNYQELSRMLAGMIAKSKKFCK